MHKKILFVVLMITLVGCTIGRGSTSKIKDIEIRTGTEGLYMELMKKSVPDIVYEDELVPVSILLQNKGASDITNGYLILGLEDTMELEEGDGKQAIRLKGRSIGNPVGDKENYNFYLRILDMSPQTEIMTSSIKLVAEYPYQTKAYANVCIDTDPYDELTTKGIKKACSAKDVSLSGGQGAPISVVKIVPYMKLGDKEVIRPYFDIYIKNVGGGDLISYYDKLDELTVQASLAEEPLDCNIMDEETQGNEEDYAEEVNIQKQKKIRCYSTLDIAKTIPSYVSLLEVTLDYWYSQSISKNVQIKTTSTTI